MGVTEDHRWKTGERGIGAFDQWRVERDWRMVRVPTERDPGIDGFIQVTGEGGHPTGEVFAVQVKSGASYRRAKGYAVPVEQHRQSWRHASVPVIAVVYDPDSKQLLWGNATEQLLAEPKLTYIKVTFDLPLPDQDPVPLLRSIRLSTDFRGGLPRGLGSIQSREQVEAAWQCLVLGFQSPYALIALRRVLPPLQPPAAKEAVVVLSHCTPHPDIFWTSGTLLPNEIRKLVSASMFWSTSEVRFLLGLIDDENGVDRGSFGQDVYMLIFEDPHHVDLLGQVAVEAADEDPTVAGWAAYLAVAAAEQQAEQWDVLLKRQPAVRDTFVFEHITDLLAKGCPISLE